ncbi:MAG: hypothetical protein WD359_04565 [Dehalococcoidia bacterium]
MFEILEAFKLAGIRVSLGFQGDIGQTALALNVVDAYSTGIGYRERFDHSGVMSRQRRLTGQAKPSGGPTAGVFLPLAEGTVPRRLAQALYSDESIRTRLACDLGGCAKQIDAPVNDPRAHYLHSRASRVEEILRYPPAWRPSHERDRLRTAIEFRERLNAHQLPTYTRKFKTQEKIGTRTMNALLTQVDRRIDASKSA